MPPRRNNNGSSSLIEISSDGGDSFHSANSGSVQVISEGGAAPPAAAGAAGARGAEANEITSAPRRSTRVRVPATFTPPSPTQLRARRAPPTRSAVASSPEELVRVKRQAVSEEEEERGRDGVNDRRAAERAGAGPSSHAPDIRTDIDDLENLAAQIERYNTQAAAALSKARPTAMEMERGVRAVMRLMLFRSGRSPGVPVKREQLSVIVRAAAASAGDVGGGGGGGRGAGGGRGGGRGGGAGGSRGAGSRVSAAAAAAAASSQISWNKTLSILKEAQARFARTLALEMHEVRLLPASAAGKATAIASASVSAAAAAGAGAAGAGRRVSGSCSSLLPSLPPSAAAANAAHNAFTAYVLRTLLPPRLLSRSRSQSDPFNPTRDAPAVALVAAAMVRLDRGGAGTPARDLWNVLSELGLRTNSHSNSNRSNKNVVPGIGDPSEAITAALASRLLVEKRGERDRETGQPVTCYALGEAAMGADGRCSGVDEFITTMFEEPDPAVAGIFSEGA